MEFQKAVRGVRPPKILLSGPAGGGKTKSALRLMTGLLGPKGTKLLVDSENNSSTIYANEFDFLIYNLPKTEQDIKGYLAIMEKASKSVNGLIIDGITPGWKSILDLSAKMEGNSYTNWSKLTPLYDKFKDAVVAYPIPLICTVRSKQDYVLELNDKGKQVPKKVGLAMEAGKDIDFDFDIVFAIDQTTNKAKIDKCRYSEIVDYFNANGEEILLTEEIGELIRKIIKGEQ